MRVAPNIYRCVDQDGQLVGWRVYVRRRDPITRQSKQTAKRFKPHFELEEIEYFRDTYKTESKKLRREARRRAADTVAALAGTVAQDAATYLALETVKGMPSYKDRARDIRRWVEALRDPASGKSLLRAAVTTRQIDEQLQQRRNAGAAASTVNGWRTALMALYSRLDGRGAANPVRTSMVFEEPELEARGIPFNLVLVILDAIPDGRSHSHLKPTTVRHLKTKPRIVLEALTGMRPSQIGRIEPRHFSIAERWYVIPRSKKGTQHRRPRNPRPSTRKHMTDRQADAFRRFDALDCYGMYSASSRRRIFKAAIKIAERTIRQQLRDRKFHFPADLRPYDLRHSFGTEMLRVTGNLETTAEMLDQSTTRMTRRYSLGAIPAMLKTAALAFEAGLASAPPARGDQVRPPKAPRRRR